MWDCLYGVLGGRGGGGGSQVSESLKDSIPTSIFLLPTHRLGLPSHAKLELSVGNELLRKTDNHCYVMNCSVPLRDKMVG